MEIETVGSGRTVRLEKFPVGGEGTDIPSYVVQCVFGADGNTRQITLCLLDEVEINTPISPKVFDPDLPEGSVFQDHRSSYDNPSLAVLKSPTAISDIVEGRAGFAVLKRSLEKEIESR